jgi:radical SAM protein with 4Fe4S-binding SPASM domain
LAELTRQFAEIRSRYPDIELVENLTLGGPPPLDGEAKRAMWSNRIGCGGGWYALGIAPDGAAFLCEQMKIDEETIVGDARTQSILEIWNSDRLRRFIHPTREQFQGTICRDCEEFEECMWEKGRCYRDTYYSYGTLYEAVPLCPRQTRPGLVLS